MILSQTVLYILDNTGVKRARCIHIEKKPFNRFGVPGDTCVGVVIGIKKACSVKNYKRGDLVRMLIVSTRKEKPLAPFSGFFFKNVSMNAALLVQPVSKATMALNPVGSRYDSFLPSFFKTKGAFFVATMSQTNIL